MKIKNKTINKNNKTKQTDNSINICNYELISATLIAGKLVHCECNNYR